MSRKPPRREVEPSGDAKIESQERLQKVLAAAGVGSRRDCEELITQGRVEVDRQVVTELGTKVDPLQHEIRVDGVMLHRPKKLYFAVNKPEGVVTTNFDPSGRMRVIDLVPTEERVFAIGRLDRASEGLILVTNDGNLANRVTHPRYGVEKVYHVRVEGSPSNEELMKLKRGVHIAEGVARVQSVKVKSRHKHVTDLEIVLKEGKNREIRRILVKIGHKVLSLKRLSVGPVKLGELKSGSARKLMPQEVEALFEAAKQYRKDSKKKRTRTTDEAERSDSQTAAGKSGRANTAPERKPHVPSAPPKIDLATLLNPSLAPKKAMPVNSPLRKPPRPAAGDVLGYNQPDSDSLEPFQAPEKKPRRRQLRQYETDAEPIEHLDDPLRNPEHFGAPSSAAEAVEPSRSRTKSARGAKQTEAPRGRNPRGKALRAKPVGGKRPTRSGGRRLDRASTETQVGPKKSGPKRSGPKRSGTARAAARPAKGSARPMKKARKRRGR